MTDGAQPLIFDILVKIQTELGSLRAELGSLRGDVMPRLERVEDLLLKQRRSMAGMLVSMTAVTGEFDGRVGRLERRVTVLEEHLPA
jgi:hypothetical protein